MSKIAEECLSSQIARREVEGLKSLEVVGIVAGSNRLLRWESARRVRRLLSERRLRREKGSCDEGTIRKRTRGSPWRRGERVVAVRSDSIRAWTGGRRQRMELVRVTDVGDASDTGHMLGEDLVLGSERLGSAIAGRDKRSWLRRRVLKRAKGFASVFVLVTRGEGLALWSGSSRRGSWFGGVAKDGGRDDWRW
jgi:hypothetical protein